MIDLPTDDDAEHIAALRSRGALDRHDGRPLLAGRDSPTHDQICANQGPWWRGLPEHAPQEHPMTTLTEIPVANLHPRPTNLRVTADGTDLVASIKAEGILQPLNVSPNGQDGHYWVNAGHRRLDAAKKAKLATVPCLVDEGRQDDTSIAFAMLIENMQRSDLSPVEQARGFERLVELGVKQKEIAAHVGISTSLVSRRLSLLQLPDDILQLIHDGEISIEKAEPWTKLPEDLVTIAATNQWDKWRCDQALAEIAEKERRTELEKIAHDNGITVIDARQIGRLVSSGSNKEYRYLAGDVYRAKPIEPTPIDLQEAATAKGFAGVTIISKYDPTVGDSRLILVAVGTKNRPKPTKTSTGGSSGTSAADRRKADERRNAEQEHWEAFGPQLVAKKIPIAKATTFFQRSMLSGHPDCRKVCDLLGIEATWNDAGPKLLEAFDNAKGPAASRILVAAAYALDAELEYLGPTDDMVATYTELGWQPLPEDGDGGS